MDVRAAEAMHLGQARGLDPIAVLQHFVTGLTSAEEAALRALLEESGA